MQRQLIGNLVFFALCGVGITAQSGVPNKPDSPETASAVHRLYVEDQEDGKTVKSDAANAQYLERVKVRQAALRTMLAAGQVTSADDFLEAGSLFQHGTQYIMDRTQPVHIAGAPFPFGRTLEPYRESFLSDSIRADFCVPTLAQQKQNIGMFNAGKWPRETMRLSCP